ncbi:hypothetical protein EDD16DRAFT_1127288 [Pisolithus croceorrhizus]|nr:hypothetical protein EDD16DRAFT_1127288 [Pisolithus croceorrhizus]KAI6134315.1 hypothetical protein EV401DRAFT_1347792 [Pisolithus croceorrhizus]KAI6146552.1 hypothetical protein EDD17DRAFT_1879650 [Pisolithus thermaeus]
MRRTNFPPVRKPPAHTHAIATGTGSSRRHAKAQQQACAVFTAIATWLTEMYRKSIELMQVIYTHILGTAAWVLSMNRVSSYFIACAATRQLTRSNDADELEAVQVEDTLAAVLASGSQPRRFDNTSESAWNILESPRITTKTPLLQKELVDMGKALEDTTVGRHLRHNRPVIVHGRGRRLFGG